MLSVVKLALAVLAALAVPAHAHAEPCGDLVRLDNAVNALLILANNPTTKIDASYLDRCPRDLVVPAQKEMLVRFNIACAAIFETDPGHVMCVTVAIQIDKRKIGPRELFDSVRGWEHDPWAGSRLPIGGNRVLALYQKLGDQRAVAVVQETWTAAEATHKADSLTGWQKKQAIATWRGWRVQAAAVLGTLALRGDTSVVEFLEEQAKTTDTVVARACRDAVRAIERRK